MKTIVSFRNYDGELEKILESKHVGELEKILESFTLRSFYG